MTPQATAPGKSQGIAPERRIWRFWPGSLAFNLAVASLAGVLYSILLMGTAPLNPRNVDWLTPDPATYQVAWELFRQDPHLHWPLTFTDRIGYPQGEAIALMDPNPLLALLLKPLSPVLPEPFQYMGIEVILVLTLQTFFALRLFRLLCGPRPLPILAGAAFLLLSPPLTYRLVGHYALTNHWLVLAALFVFCLPQADSAYSVRRYFSYSAALAFLSLAINPYLAFQVLLVLGSGAVTLLWQRRVSFVGFLGGLTAIGSAALFTCVAFGLFIPGGHGYGGSGYRFYSMNLLSVMDPALLGSVLIPALPEFTSGQYEGYNYLGAGFLLIALAVLPLLALRRGRLRLTRQVVLPLLGVCALLTLMALSTKISAGRHLLIDLDPRERLTPLLAPFRASGRLFWAPYYALMIAVLAGAFAVLNRRVATGLVLAGLAVQIADTAPQRRWTHEEVNGSHPQPLHSAIWTTLGARYANLMVIPPWQCGGDTPGDGAGYRTFGFLAAQQKMRTNSYYAARYSESANNYQCSRLETEVAGGALSADSVYVVSPAIAARIAESPAGADKCHDVDGFILCAANTDFGLGPALTRPEERLRFAIQNEGFEEADMAPWAPYLDIRPALASDPVHGGSHSLAEWGSRGSVYQDATGLESGQTYAVSAWASSSREGTATAEIGLYDPGTNVAVFSAAVAPRGTWTLVTRSFRASAARTIRVHLFRNKGEGIIFWDDVRIFKLK